MWQGGYLPGTGAGWLFRCAQLTRTRGVGFGCVPKPTRVTRGYSHTFTHYSNTKYVGYKAIIKNNHAAWQQRPRRTMLGLGGGWHCWRVVVADVADGLGWLRMVADGRGWSWMERMGVDGRGWSGWVWMDADGRGWLCCDYQVGCKEEKNTYLMHGGQPACGRPMTLEVVVVVVVPWCNG